MNKLDHYQWAVIRLATLQERGKAGTLLFATVTLLAPGRSLPTKMKGVEKCFVNKTTMVFFRRTILNRQAAIDWYRSLGNGNEKTPVPFHVEDVEEKLDGRNIVVSKLIDNPAWPHLGLPMGEGLIAQPTGRSHPAPFIGSVPARIHRRFGSADNFNTLLANNEALAFMARRLHIDLRRYPEYLGSVALVVPDPIIKQIDNFMIPSRDQHGERVFYRFIPRPGQTLEGLQITTFDEEAHLLTSFETLDVPIDGILDVDKGNCFGTYGYVVRHREYGVLAHMPPTGFLRSIEFNSHAISGGVKINVPISDSPNSSRMEYLAGNRSHLSTSTIVGDEVSPLNVSSRVAIASSQRDRVAIAQEYGQRWFPNGSREEAMRFIQGEIRKARERVIIADPYWGSLQVGQFLYVVDGNAVNVTLLTSSLAFKGDKLKSKIEKLKSFKKMIGQLDTDAKVIVDARVLPSSALHDRFLVIDNIVWFLGNSLNTLGDKASMLVKLPNPDEVIKQLQSMKVKAETLNSYIETVLNGLKRAGQRNE
jgi:hypothetical protein